jgi:hypothetical protein
VPSLERELSFVWPCKQKYPRDEPDMIQAMSEYRAAAKLLLGHDVLQHAQADGAAQTSHGAFRLQQSL